jgi:hypothetical protein
MEEGKAGNRGRGNLWMEERESCEWRKGNAENEEMGKLGIEEEESWE